MTSNKNLQLPFVQEALKKCLNLRNYKIKANRFDYSMYENSLNDINQEHVDTIVSLKHEVLDRQMSLLKIVDESKHIQLRDINRINNIQNKILKSRNQEVRLLASKYRVKLINEPKISNCYQRIKEMIEMKKRENLKLKVNDNLIYPNFKRRSEFLNSLKSEALRKEETSDIINRSDGVLKTLRKKYETKQFKFDNDAAKNKEIKPHEWQTKNCEYTENVNYVKEETDPYSSNTAFPNIDYPFISRGNTELTRN
uniref:Uncharacterized protein n=1 Tax=Schmidtea mediterranea TaxID=79327 RepID=A0A5P8I4L3_SCHMD|nr:hypothetical protein [Schmidtea mediterranea]